MVVSGSPLASEVGREILQAGGNAVDAAVAVGFALAVVHPEAGNIGGGGFMIFRLADGVTRALDYREAAPGRGAHDMYLDRAGDPTALSDKGHLAAGVPGSVAGMVEAHRRFGRLPFARGDRAGHRARERGLRGRRVPQPFDRRLPGLALHLPRLAPLLPPRRGQAPAPGSRWSQQDLGRTLEAIRDHGADGFYRGWVADSIVAEMERGGGLITPRGPRGLPARSGASRCGSATGATPSTRCRRPPRAASPWA